ncbi:hypothetical protein BJ741DRAFT_600911 [Chytriomyces cf. hyalinus JEL632]|nr:hypothetical protein BJ741DRAFT_600911 [Chytriomyces cf. hyalinus JEL632]
MLPVAFLAIFLSPLLTATAVAQEPTSFHYLQPGDPCPETTTPATVASYCRVDARVHKHMILKCNVDNNVLEFFTLCPGPRDLATFTECTVGTDVSACHAPVAGRLGANEAVDAKLSTEKRADTPSPEPEVNGNSALQEPAQLLETEPTVEVSDVHIEVSDASSSGNVAPELVTDNAALINTTTEGQSNDDAMGNQAVAEGISVPESNNPVSEPKVTNEDSAHSTNPQLVEPVSNAVVRGSGIQNAGVEAGVLHPSESDSSGNAAGNPIPKPIADQIAQASLDLNSSTDIPPPDLQSPTTQSEVVQVTVDAQTSMPNPLANENLIPPVPGAIQANFVNTQESVIESSVGTAGEVQSTQISVQHVEHETLIGVDVLPISSTPVIESAAKQVDPVIENLPAPESGQISLPTSGNGVRGSSASVNETILPKQDAADVVPDVPPESSSNESPHDSSPHNSPNILGQDASANDPPKESIESSQQHEDPRQEAEQPRFEGTPSEGNNSTVTDHEPETQPALTQENIGVSFDSESKKVPPVVEQVPVAMEGSADKLPHVKASNLSPGTETRSGSAVEGASCSRNGAYDCATGASAILVCSAGVWVGISCDSGNNCKMIGGFPYCV